MAVLVTGAAGFIGSHVAARLLDQGQTVVGVDCLSPYYDVSLKRHRLERLVSIEGFRFIHAKIEDLTSEDLGEMPSRIVHLGAQPGVRYSLANPAAYIDSNVVGFARILEIAREVSPEHFVYASSSSVYGANVKTPYSVSDEINHPVSLYAATKRSNELMAQAYSHLFELPSTGLRFFTVYGPRGRPDMAIFDFTRRILQGEPIYLYGAGSLSRDFTYVDDVVDGVLLALNRPPRPGPATGSGVNESGAAHRVFNIGKGRPETVLDLVEALEESLNRKAVRILSDRQPGDVDHTWADTRDFREWCGFTPNTDLRSGVEKFTDWYLDYYSVGT